MNVESIPFGEVDGREVQLFRCPNRAGVTMAVTNYGAILVSLEAPDRRGMPANLCLGFDSLAGYQRRHPYFGATVGRYCNRIARGEFSLDGQVYSLATNNGEHHLHGGDRGFDRFVWDAEPFEGEGIAGVRLRRTSPDGEEGYPGALRVEADYVLDEDSRLRIEFRAVTDRATHVNLTNHGYWNLAGAGAGKIDDQRVQIFGQKYLEVDETLIPTGRQLPVDGTPLDFREPKPLGRELADVEADPPGYDHCFVLEGPSSPGEVRLAARAADPASGRVMEVHTDQVGLQLYTGNFLDGGPDCGGFGQHEAFCLETQHFPDTPNRPEFPSTRLEPGQEYRTVTVLAFSTDV